MDHKIYLELAQPQHTDFHTKLLNLCRSYLDISLAQTRSYFPRWDAALDAYNAKIQARRKDEYAYEDERPASQSIPMTFAQVNTWEAFCTQILDQRPRQFEQGPVGREDSLSADLCETLLQSDIASNQWAIRRGQILQNIGNCGIAAVRTEFAEEKIGIQVTQEIAGAVAFEQTFGTGHTVEQQEVVKRRGNLITVISPYRYFPDPAYQLCDQQRSRFQGDEFEISRQELAMQESAKQVAGIIHIPRDFPVDRWNNRYSGYDRGTHSRFDSYRYQDNKNDIVCITRMQMKLVPSAMVLMDGTPMGPSNVPCIMDVWMANDSRIIKCEISNYLHGQFCYDVAAFDNEMHVLLGKSLSEIMDRLQETIDWFINSRMEAVSRNIEPQMVVDPYAVEVSDLQLGERIIRLKKGMGRVGLDSFVKQLQMSDPTARHMDDIAQFTRIIQNVTGVNDNMSGQFHTGRRSATEAKVVAGGAASRVMSTLKKIWEGLFCPMGTKLLINLRQGLTPEDIYKYAGEQPPEVIQHFKSDALTLATSRDFWTLDGTSPSEKGFQAQWLQEMLSALLANPIAAMQLDLSPRLLMEKAMELMGINLREDVRLSKDPQLLQQMVMQMATQIAQQMVQQQQLEQQSQQPPSNGPV